MLRQHFFNDLKTFSSERKSLILFSLPYILDPVYLVAVFYRVQQPWNLTLLPTSCSKLRMWNPVSLPSAKYSASRRPLMSRTRWNNCQISFLKLQITDISWNWLYSRLNQSCVRRYFGPRPLSTQADFKHQPPALGFRCFWCCRIFVQCAGHISLASCSKRSSLASPATPSIDRFPDSKFVAGRTMLASVQQWPPLVVLWPTTA